MTLQPLDNLVKIQKLKIEPPDQSEFDGMVSSAKRRLQDAQIEGLSEEGRFYGAAQRRHRYIILWVFEKTKQLNSRFRRLHA
ncbi:MAG: hypothetical protein COA83_06715 [Methylophaga sp.]|nr:MAG: hypothetical protein COA83_06715 [Methylophaga sp.]